MSNKIQKKIRRSFRGAIKSLGERYHNDRFWKLARQRDIVFIIALVEFIFIIFLNWLLWKI